VYSEERKLILKLIRENGQLEESNREHCEDKVYLHEDIDNLKERLKCAYELGKKEGDKQDREKEAFELGKKCMSDFVIQECNTIMNKLKSEPTINYVHVGKFQAYETILEILERKNK